MKAWYEKMIEQCQQEWSSLIITDPKAALHKMQDINNYRTMLQQCSYS